jgi:zinc protease
VIVVLFAAAAGAALPPMPRIGVPVPTWTIDASEMCLASGLRVQVVQRPDTGVVAITTVVGGGTSAETAETRGAAHLVEHLWFRSHPGGAASPRERDAGVLLDGRTLHDATAFVTVGAPADLEGLLAMEVQKLVDPLQGIDAATVEDERAVVANELAWRGDATQRAALRYLDARLWPTGHPYATSVTPIDANAALGLDDLRGYAKTAYIPANASIRIEGAVDVGAFGDIWDRAVPAALRAGPHPGCEHPPIADPPPAPLDTALAVVDAPVWKPTLYLAWSLPPSGGPDEVVARLAVDVLGESVWRGLGFLKGIRRDDRFAVGCEYVPGRLAAEAICSVALPDGVDPREALPAIRSELPRQWDETIRTTRLRTLASAIPERYIGVFDALDRFDEDALIDRGLSTWQGRADPVAPVVDTVLGIEDPTTSSFARQWLTADRSVAVVLRPADAPAVAGVVPSGVARLDVAPVVWHTDATPLAVTASTLENGVDVWVLPRRDAAYIQESALVCEGGWATSPVAGANELLAHLMYTASPDATNESRYEGAVLEEYEYGSSTDAYAARSPAGELDLALWNLRWSVGPAQFDWSGRQPRLDPLVEGAFEAFRELPWSTSDALAMAHLLPGDRAAVPWWDGLRAARSVHSQDVEAWERTVRRPDNATLVVAGPVDPAVVAAEAERYLGGWSAGGKPLAAVAAPLPPAPARQAMLYAASTVLSEVSVQCRLPGRSDATAPGLDVLRAVVDKALWRSLRDDGGIYGFGATLDPLDPRVTILSLDASVPPAASAPTVAAMLGVLDAIRAGTPASALAWGRAAARGDRMRELATAPASWELLRGVAGRGGSLDALRSYPDDVDRVDAAALSALIVDCDGHEAVSVIGPDPGHGLSQLATTDVDWGAVGAQLAESLK